jgi:hypothetical protein
LLTLDHIAVDQPHLPDTDTGERQCRPAAKAADAEHRDLCVAQSLLAFRRRALAPNVAEATELTVKAFEHAGCKPVIVGGGLQRTEVPQLREGVVDRLATKLFV